MSELWTRPVVAIKNGAETVGAGMLAPGNTVLTCAHVIRRALERTGVAAGPGVTVKVDLPFAGLNNLAATVAKAGWHPEIPEIERGAGTPPSDVAVLELSEPEAVIAVEPALIAEIDPAAGTAFSSYGFPVGYRNGALAEGTLRNADAGGWLDAIADVAFGHFVEPGFSGAPIFTRQGSEVAAGQCLGICVTNDAGGKRIARMIPPAHLAEVLRAVISPYRWLSAFEARDAPFFFGREALADALWKELSEHRFLLLAGGPGTGKSSVLKAGLAHRAAAKGYSVHIIRPLADARAELATAFGVSREASTTDIAAAIGSRGEKRKLLLGIDQAEELAHGNQAESAAGFLKMLAELRENLGEQLLTALSARGDALDLLFRVQPRPGGRLHPGLLERHLRFLDPLGREELRAAVERPAARLRVRFARGLAERLVEDAIRDQVPLPVVQLCLSRLWDRRSGGDIPITAYNEMNGVRGALARHASELLDEIRAAARQIFEPGIGERLVAQARRILVHLVEVGPSNKDDRRRRVPIAELPQPSLRFCSDRPGLATAHRILEDGRLIVATRLADGTEALELAHDSLLIEWTELREWLDEDRAFRLWHDRLLARVQNTPNDLLSGPALLEAEQLWESELKDQEGETRIDTRVATFIMRSREANRRREEEEEIRLRKERAVALRMGSLFLAERARQLTARGEPMTGMLLALEALPDLDSGRERPVMPEAIFALGEAWARNHERLRLSTGGLVHAAFSPDGDRILTASQDKTARVWDTASGTPLATCEGHIGSVRLAAFSPDGDRILTASDDKTARVWDASGALIATCEGHTGPVPHATFSPGGDRILTTSHDNTARVWNAASGALIAICEGHTGWVLHAAFSPDGTRILTASDDKTARVWDASGALIATCEGHAGWVLHAAFSPDGDRILTASDDKTARVWDASGALIATCEGHTGPVPHATFSPGGDRILTTSHDNTARVWNAASGALIAICEGHAGWVLHAAFSPDGTRILTASDDKTARVWDASGALIATCEGHTGPVPHAAFSPDGDRILTASYDDTARVWGAAFGEPLATCEGHIGSVLHATFSPDGDRILTASDDKTARVWNATSGAPFATCEGHTGPVRHAAFSPGGTRILTASDDKTARVWDASGALIATCEGHAGWVLHAAFSPDGTRILTASDDKTARVWDASGVLIATCEGHTGPVPHAAFSPDGDRILTASDDKTARVWGAAFGEPLATCEGHIGPVLHAAFSPDGDRILTASDDKTARVWNATSGAPFATCEGHTGPVRHAAFSPGGTRILTASDDKTARVWDTVTGAPLAICEGHTGSVPYAAFSPDGTRILTASQDKTARVWDTASGALLATYEGRTGWVLHAAFSPDGARILTASDDKTAQVWRHFRDTGEAVAFIKPLLTCSLTAQQRRNNYLPPLPDPLADAAPVGNR